MHQNLEHDQQASSEIRKKELQKKRVWKIFKWFLTIAKIIFKLFFLEEYDLPDE